MAWIRILVLLLASGYAQPSPSRRLSARPLHQSSTNAVTASGASNAAGNNANTGGLSLHLANTSSSIPSPPPSSPPWELEVEPYLADLYPARDPNTTVLRGPPRLAGVFKGNWLRTVYGDSLRPRGSLSSERGGIVLRFADDESPGAGRGGGPAARLHAGDLQELPGGLQELRGEVVIRDGDSLADHSLSFRLRGTYVPAAGTVHAVLEPQLPSMLHSELPSTSTTTTTTSVSRSNSRDAGPAGKPGRDASGGGVVEREATAESASGGVAGSGYREALRTAARNMVILGPSWHRVLLRSPPPSPPAPHGGRGSGNRRRAAIATGGGGGGPSPPPSPPRPPLELALFQTCELRMDFRVYYKGDPDAGAHVHFLRLDQPAAPPSPPSPPSPPPRAAASTTADSGDGQRGRGGGGGVRASAPSVNSVGAGATAAAAVAAPAAAGSSAVSAGDSSLLAGKQGTGTSSAVVQQQQGQQQRRRLAADTEIYHSTQMQLHAAEQAAAAAGADATAAAAAAPDAVYGIPPGMDPQDPDLDLVGVVISTNCDFTLHFNASSVHLERYYRQAVRYSVVVAAVTISQIVLSVSQSEASSTPSAAARMSLYSVTLQAILDAYQCLMHLAGALVVDALFAAFASIAFLQFLLFAVFEMRQTLLVWRAQRTNGTGGGDFWTVRRDMSAVYFRFYALLLSGLLLMFQLRSQLALLVLALHSWWLPQLIHSAQTDTRPPLKSSYVWGMSALRLVAPLYFYGCPSNLLRVEQHPGVCVALAVWVVLQAALVTMQARLGPRVLVPRAFLPRRYDYHRTATKREMGIEEPHSATPHTPAGGAGGTSSSGSPPGSGSAGGSTSTAQWWSWLRWPSAGPGRAVPLVRRLAAWLPSGAWLRRESMFSLGPAGAGAALRCGPPTSLLHRGGGGSRRSGGGSDGGDVETGHGSKECVICMSPVPLLPLNARMLTPCGHFFHEACLTRWMEVKMDCPTCRRPLPPA